MKRTEEEMSEVVGVFHRVDGLQHLVGGDQRVALLVQIKEESFLLLAIAENEPGYPTTRMRGAKGQINRRLLNLSLFV